MPWEKKIGVVEGEVDGGGMGRHFFLKGGWRGGNTLPKFNMEPENDGFFSKRISLFHPFPGTSFQVPAVKFFGGVSISGHWTFPVFYFNLLYVSSWTFRQEEHEFLRNSMQMRR